MFFHLQIRNHLIIIKCHIKSINFLIRKYKLTLYIKNKYSIIKFIKILIDFCKDFIIFFRKIENSKILGNKHDMKYT